MSAYTFFLRFVKDDVTIEIEEPFEFDAFSHSIERKLNGFSNDVYLFAETTSLLFTNTAFARTDEYEDIDGTVMFNLTHGLKRIIDSYKEYGADGDIELSIYYDDIQITRCDFDLEDVDTDLLTYFKCGFIDGSRRAKHKAKEDDVMVNIYSDVNLDGQPIEKLEPMKVLLWNRPISVGSKWIKTDIPYAGAPNNVTTKFPTGGYRYFNFCKAITESGIEDTLSPSAFDASNVYSDTYDGSMKIIDSKTSKKQITVKITCDIEMTHIQNGRVGYANETELLLYLRVSKSPVEADSVLYQLYSRKFSGTETQSAKVPVDISFTLPTGLSNGEFVTLFWEYKWDSGTIALTADYSQIDNYSHIDFLDNTVEIDAVEESINSVIQGVRWIDVLKKSAEIISGLTVDAPRIDVGGEYYNTLVTTGGGVRNISNIPFNIKTKDAFDMGMMVAMDYQVSDSTILVGQYTDFFSDKLLRQFTVPPSEKFNWNTSKEYRIKTFDYKFKNYEQDRDEQYTLDAVHTEEQLLLPNVKPTNIKKVEIVQILDTYKIDSLRRLGIDTETEDSSLTDDTDLVMLKIVPMSEGLLQTYAGKLSITATANGIKIYSTEFRWDKIGLGLTSSFSILSGPNTGSYTVLVIESELLTLEKISAVNNVSEVNIISIEYSLEGVYYMSERDEQFSEVTGVLAPDAFANLIYTKSRNIERWKPFLSTCAMNYIGGEIQVSFLKSNQELYTKLKTESTGIKEIDSIKVDDIAELRRLTDNIFTVTIYLDDATDIINIFNEQNVRNPDGTIGGYYEFIGPDGKSVFGYPKKMEFIPFENKIEAVCFERYEPGNGFVYLNDADRSLYKQYAAFGIYITVYNADDTIFCYEKRFTRIIINGKRYTEIELFLNDLELFFS